MNVKFKILKRDNKLVNVVGLEYESGYYSSDTSSTKGIFAYEDTATVNFLFKVDSEEKETLVDVTACEHVISEETALQDYTVMKFTEDGLYRIVHCILPTKLWYDGHQTIYSYTYYYDNGNIYNKTGAMLNLTALEEFPNLNFTSDYSVVKDDVYTFTIEDLLACLYKISLPLLKSLCVGCTKDSGAIFNRDFVWMAINCIQYCLDLDNFFLALKIVEEISSCSSICSSDSTSSSTSNSSCGCHASV